MSLRINELLTPSSQNSWQGDPDSVDVDDIAFVTQMISSLSDTYCLDNRRIYATGKSNGAGFVNILACDAHLSTKIAAFAAVSGAFYIPGVNQTDCIAGIPQTAHFPCTPGRNQIPMMEFHGLNDDVIAVCCSPPYSPPLRMIFFFRSHLLFLLSRPEAREISTD